MKQTIFKCIVSFLVLGVLGWVSFTFLIAPGGKEGGVMPIIKNTSKSRIISLSVRTDELGERVGLKKDQYDSKAILDYLGMCKKKKTSDKPGLWPSNRVDIDIVFSSDGKEFVLMLGEINYVHNTKETDPYLYELIASDEMRRTIYGYLDVEDMNLPWSY